MSGFKPGLGETPHVTADDAEIDGADVLERAEEVADWRSFGSDDDDFTA